MTFILKTVHTSSYIKKHTIFPGSVRLSIPTVRYCLSTDPEDDDWC